MKLPPSQETLQSLAPDGLKSYRTDRYAGDDVAVPLSAMGQMDRESIARIYRTLQQLFVATGSGQAKEAERFVEADGIKTLLVEAERLGRDTARDSRDLRRALHDIRGGALTALLGRLQLVEAGWVVEEQMRPLFLLARDHLKIMRNILVGLDDPARERDMEAKRHSVNLLAEKWAEAELYTGQRKVQVLFESEFDGDISERCIEFGSLDRVLYNLINNAARHASEPKVSISCVPVPGDGQGNLRFVVANPIEPDHGRRLDENLGESLHGLFESDFSTTGSGIGLGICSLIVANAFGVPTVSRAVQEKYLGAAVRENCFFSWFHWPVVA